MAVSLYLASKPLNPIIRTKHISRQHKWPQEIIIKNSENQLILCHLHVFIIMNTTIQLFANVVALASKPLSLILSNSHQTRHYFEKLSTSTPFKAKKLRNQS